MKFIPYPGVRITVDFDSDTSILLCHHSLCMAGPGEMVCYFQDCEKAVNELKKANNEKERMLIINKWADFIIQHSKTAVMDRKNVVSTFKTLQKYFPDTLNMIMSMDDGFHIIDGHRSLVKSIPIGKACRKIKCGCYLGLNVDSNPWLMSVTIVKQSAKREIVPNPGILIFEAAPLEETFDRLTEGEALEALASLG